MKTISPASHLILVITTLIPLCIFSLIPVHASQTTLKGKTRMFIADGNNKFRMYTTGPESAKQGLLLIHDWLGLDRNMKLQADRYASLGYRIAAIDLYKGKVATESKQAKQLMRSVNQDYANNLYRAALQALRTADKKRKLAVIGWSFGGGQVIEAALVKPDWVSASVMYYPYGMKQYSKETLARLGGPVLGNLATNDYSFTPLKARVFQASMMQAEKEFQMNMLDARHGFDRPASKHYNKKASGQAWVVTRKFLKQHLN